MCCTSLLKMMMFIFNGGIFVAGSVVLGVGVWVKVDSNSLLGILQEVDSSVNGISQLANVSYLLIGVGAVLLVIGFLGCCGAIKESRCMLLAFFSIVLIIFFAEVAGAVVLFVFQNLAEDLLKSLENEVIVNIKENYGKDESLTSLWNGTMEEFECCGFKNYTDFEGSPFDSLFGLYPSTCCNETVVTTDKCDFNGAERSNMDGCFDKLLKLLEDNATIVAAVALGIAALEIAAMVVSMVLYQSIGRNK